MRSRGLRSILRMSSAAASGARPNLEPSCPVSTCACVSAVTPGMTRTSTSCAPPSGTVASSRSTSSALSTTTRPSPCSTAMAISSSDLALPCSTSVAGSAPALSAVTISPAPATSSPRPSSTITRWTAVHGNAFEANTTRERGHRAASSVLYSRARARSACSATTSTGVPNSRARSSARQPPTLSIPSASSVLPGGNNDSTAMTGASCSSRARATVPRTNLRRELWSRDGFTRGCVRERITACPVRRRRFAGSRRSAPSSAPTRRRSTSSRRPRSTCSASTAGCGTSSTSTTSTPSRATTRACSSRSSGRTASSSRWRRSAPTSCAIRRCSTASSAAGRAKTRARPCS